MIDLIFKITLTTIMPIKLGIQLPLVLPVPLISKFTAAGVDPPNMMMETSHIIVSLRQIQLKLLNSSHIFIRVHVIGYKSYSQKYSAFAIFHLLLLLL